MIGAIVVAVAAAVLAFAYMRTGSGGLSGYEIQARLPQVDGLGVGTDVRLSGIKIGSVSDLTLDPKTYLVTVHMNIRDDIKIPDDSSLMVTSSGLLGSSYLSITPGGDDKMLAAGGMIENSPRIGGSDGTDRPVRHSRRRSKPPSSRRRGRARERNLGRSPWSLASAGVPGCGISIALAQTPAPPAAADAPAADTPDATAPTR